MKATSLRVTINNGKYIVVQTPEGTHALRYSEPWRDTTGDGLILSLAQEVETLRELLRAAYPDLDSGAFCNPDQELLEAIKAQIDVLDSDSE